MSSITSATRFTVAEYLARERVADQKSEYFRGELFAMAGGTANHSLIATNTIRALGNRLEDTPCRVYNTDMRVKCPTELFTYPDISIACAQPEFDDGRRDTLLNPRVIIEVLSDSTETYDRTKKFEHYRSIPSLQDFVLISQNQSRVERYSREEDANHWRVAFAASLDDVIDLPALDVSISLREIYAKVEFPPPPPLPEGSVLKPSASPEQGHA